MAIQQLKSQIARLPEQPGVYLFFNDRGETIYVGKARALRDRVRSYLGAFGLDPKTDALLDEAARLEVIVTDSVVEALALENNLIKQRTPRYNILLRDDKSYPYLQLTTGEAFPRVLVARYVERDEHFYAGPFLPASLARRTMSLTHRLFGMRSCNEVIDGKRSRPCLEYDINRCIAPCVAEICSPDAYTRAVADTRLFLEGRNEELADVLRGRMTAAADQEKYEEAAHLRDALRVVQTLADRQQKMAIPRLGDRDAFGVKVGPSGAVVQVFQMRSGRVVERIELETDASYATTGGESDVLQAALQQFYEAHTPASEVHVPFELEERETLEAWLAARAVTRVSIVVPRRGEKRALLDLAARNADLAYQSRFNEQTAAFFDALEGLRAALSLPTLPRRIEGFDISTIQGSETVASMVVCENGRMKRSEYRKFRIRGSGIGDQGSVGRRPRLPFGPAADPRPPIPDPLAKAPDDFASMREVVFRHFRKVLEEGGPFPDLIMIDGGPGQLSAAYDALEALGLASLVAVGLAKKEEVLFTRDAAAPLVLPRDSPALLLMQRIRDEAHRFAVTFHRKARSMRDLRSELDQIAGVGPRRRAALLRAFGSVAGVRRASQEQLASVVGAKAAEAVLRHFLTQV